MSQGTISMLSNLLSNSGILTAAHPLHLPSPDTNPENLPQVHFLPESADSHTGTSRRHCQLGSSRELGLQFASSIALLKASHLSGVCRLISLRKKLLESPLFLTLTSGLAASCPRWSGKGPQQQGTCWSEFMCSHYHKPR